MRNDVVEFQVVFGFTFCAATTVPLPDYLPDTARNMPAPSLLFWNFGLICQRRTSVKYWVCQFTWFIQQKDAEAVRIVPAELGDYSIVLGGAAIAWKRSAEER